VYRNNVEVSIPARDIGAPVRELRQQITRDYRDRPLELLSVLKGSFVFTADMAREIDRPLRIEFL
jgi:hypoxanthine phosphoribosyltransferase